ncbi:MAG: hypothetical protein JSS49_28770 [Planctomycetes bacterium]|nr:hypothetical protein [Planctomycetota bacterium]
MSATTVGLGWMELLLMVLGGGGLLGMPPGERDPEFLKAAPPQSIVYVEWAARSAGKPGVPGIDGFASDPEILALVDAIEHSLLPAEPVAEETEHEPPNLTFRLAKLISGHAGCVFAVADPVQPGVGLLNTPNPAENMSRFHVCLILNAGPDSAAIIEALKQATHFDIPLQPKMHAIPGPMGQNLTIHQDGDRLLIGMGFGTVERAMDGLRGKTPGLDANPRFAAGWKRVALDRVGSLGWVDLKGAADVATSSMGPAGLVVQAVIRGSGADALDSVVSTTGVADGNVIQRSFVTTGGRTDGVMVLTKPPALRMEQFSHIPVDSDIVLAASLDPSQVVAGIRDVLAKTNPLAVKLFDETIRELESELQLNLGQVVYPAFGNAWTAFSSPTEAGPVGTGLIMAVEVRDPEKARIVFNRLMELLEQSLVSDPELDLTSAEVKHQAFLGHSIYYVNRHGLGYGITPTIIPSFCLTSNHLLFGVHPQALKSHLRYLSVRRPGFETVAARKLSLANQELLFTGYLDGARATQTLGGLAPFIGQSFSDIALDQGYEFDPFSIPSMTALAPYAGDVTMSVVRQRDGLLAESKNPHIGIALASAIHWFRSQYHVNYETLLDARRLRRQSVQNAGLGAPEGHVAPAVAEKLAPRKETPGEIAARRATPILLRTFVPPGAQQFIPDDVLRKLAQPPTPEMLQQRDERRKQLEQRRRERAERRRIAPTP